MKDFYENRYNKERLEEVRDTLTLHLNDLYAEEHTVDNYDKLKDLTNALEFCLAGVYEELRAIEICTNMIKAETELQNDPNLR